MTIVGILRMAHIAEQAAKTLSHEHGVEAEVIDPRTLRPLDLDTILESVRKTNRLVIVEEGWPHGGVGANIAALVAEQAFDHLDAPVQRVTGADVPMPYSKRLEQSAMPHAENVVSAALATTEGAMSGPWRPRTRSVEAAMTVEIVMPRLSDSMEEGTVLRWMKAVGDDVALGEELVEIETDKANMVFEADAAGTLIEIVADEGATLPIGEVIARVGDASEAPAGGSDGDGATAPSDSPRDAADSPPDAPTLRTARRGARRRRRSRGACSARRAAATACPRCWWGEGGWAGQGEPDRAADRRGEGRRSGALQGSGPGGRIIKSDVEKRRRGRRRAAGRRRCRRAGAGAPPARPRPPRARCRSSSSQSSSRRSAGGWPSRRRPRRTSICSPSST